MDAKVCIGFAPVLPFTMEESGLTTAVYKHLKRCLYHEFLKEVAGALSRFKDGVFVMAGGRTRLLFPRWSVCVADHLEAQDEAACQQGGTGNFCCRRCWTANPDLDLGPLGPDRKLEEMVTKQRVLATEYEARKKAGRARVAGVRTAKDVDDALKKDSIIPVEVGARGRSGRRGVWAVSPGLICRTMPHCICLAPYDSADCGTPTSGRVKGASTHTPPSIGCTTCRAGTARTPSSGACRW